VRIYLDTCSLQRPLDSKAQIRVLLEADAVLGLLSLCQAGEIELVSSEALLFEVERNPNTARREYTLGALSGAASFVPLGEPVEERARALNARGLKPLDALHLASAEEGRADYLCTCNDRFLRRTQALGGLRTEVVSPVALIGEIERW
jgi:predicted nucleic acid-binding protein